MVEVNYRQSISLLSLTTVLSTKHSFIPLSLTPGLNTRSILYSFSSHDKPMSPDIVKCFQEGKTTPSWEPLVYRNEVTGPRSQISASRVGETLTRFSESLYPVYSTAVFLLPGLHLPECSLHTAPSTGPLHLLFPLPEKLFPHVFIRLISIYYRFVLIYLDLL